MTVGACFVLHSNQTKKLSPTTLSAASFHALFASFAVSKIFVSQLLNWGAKFPNSGGLSLCFLLEVFLICRCINLALPCCSS